jgi:hypothetical protein
MQISHLVMFREARYNKRLQCAEFYYYPLPKAIGSF